MASWGCWHVAGRSQAWIRLRAPQIAEGLRVCVRVEVQVESLASACVRKLGNKESGINYKLHEYLGGSNGPALASAATVGCGRETAGKEGQERWLVSSKNSPSDGRGDPKRDPEYGAFGGRGCLWRILRAIPRYTICYYPIHTIWLELRRSFRPQQRSSSQATATTAHVPSSAAAGHYYSVSVADVCKTSRKAPPFSPPILRDAKTRK